MISHRLAVAIREAIQDHVDQRHNGRMKIESVMSALGQAGADLLGEIPNPGDRLRMAAALIDALNAATWWTAQRQPDGITRQ